MLWTIASFWTASLLYLCRFETNATPTTNSMQKFPYGGQYPVPTSQDIPVYITLAVIVVFCVWQVTRLVQLMMVPVAAMCITTNANRLQLYKNCLIGDLPASHVNTHYIYRTQEEVDE